MIQTLELTKEGTTTFTVEHNLNDYGLDIENALWSWMYRTNDLSIESFCKYVISKDPSNLVCNPIKNNDNDTRPNAR